jgi:hypothetical protein
MKSQEEVEAYFIDAHTAILLGENATNVLKKSIELCPECASYSDESETLLHIAASRGTPEMIEYIVVSGGDVFLDSIKKEWTPLCWAIAKKRADNVKKLIELGANINSSEPSRSPVLLSIKDHNTEILELLIDAGADIAYQYKSKDNPWWDALSYAKYNLQDEAVEVLERELKKLNVDTEEVLANVALRQSEETDYASYVETHLGEIEQYYSHEDILECFWGGVSQIDETISIDVYGILPKNKDYGILITSGMSEYPMAETDEGFQYAEVMMKIPKEWMNEGDLLQSDYRWTIEIMYKTACLGHMYDGAYVSSKVIVPYGEPDEAYCFDWDYKFTSVMLCESEDIPVLQPDENTKVKFYTLVPITEEEEELVREKGSAAVKKMLSSGDMVDMGRELLIEPED